MEHVSESLLRAELDEMSFGQILSIFSSSLFTPLVGGHAGQ
jgi:hypothetical protein